MRLLPLSVLACYLIAVLSASNQRVKWKISFDGSKSTNKLPGLVFARIDVDDPPAPVVIPTAATCATMLCPEGSVCIERRISGPGEPVQPIDATCKPAELSSTCAVMKCNAETRCVNLEMCGGIVPGCSIVGQCVPYQPSCPKNEIYDSCGGCEGTCDNPMPICPAVCDPTNAGCRCDADKVRSKEGQCVSLSECSSTNPNCLKDETYDSCGTCESTCDNPNPICPAVCDPVKVGCKCTAPKIRNSQGLCVTVEECGVAPPTCPKDETYDPCGGCESTCEIPNPMCPEICEPAKARCKCMHPKVRNSLGQCITIEECFVAPPTCRKDETYDSCGTCESTCDDPNPICPAVCDPAKIGCKCTPPTVRNSLGQCVEVRECIGTVAPPKHCNKSNEFWNDCGVCEQTCINQNVVCAAVCQPERAGCQCYPPLVRNVEGECVSSDQCPYSTVPAPTPPRCSSNEHWDPCGGCDGTCKEPNVACPKICAHDQATCRCDHPYVRDENGRCIMVSACPVISTATPPTAQDYGRLCEERNCSKGQYCTLKESSKESQMRCMAWQNVTCACSAGEHCILRVVQCVRAPCPPQPFCVSVYPAPTTPNCNCAYGQRCQVGPTGQPMCVPNGNTNSYCPPCQYGYSCQYYYGRYQCVPSFVGNPPGGLPCTIQCPVNQMCQIINGASQCVPNTGVPGPICPMACPPGLSCQFVNGQSTCAADLPTTTPAPVCPSPCPATQSCQVLNGVAACRPLPTTPRPCTMACPVGQICQVINNRNTCVDDLEWGTTPSPIINCTMPCPYGKMCRIQNYVATCVDNENYCGPNAYLAQCGNLCEGKCQNVNSGPQACPMICAQPACACYQGFYRDPYSYQCVAAEQCPVTSNPATNPCAYTSCQYLSTCVVQNGMARCVPYGSQGGYPGQTYPGQTYPGQTYPGQTYPGQTYPGQTYPGQTYPGQTYPGQTYPGQTYPGQTGYLGQTYPGQSYNGQSSGQNYYGQTYPGQSYNGQSYQNGYNSQYPYQTGTQTGFGKKKK